MEWWQTLLGFAGTGIVSSVGTLFISRRWALTGERLAGAAVKSADTDAWAKAVSGLEALAQSLQTRLAAVEMGLSKCESEREKLRAEVLVMGSVIQKSADRIGFLESATGLAPGGKK